MSLAASLSILVVAAGSAPAHRDMAIHQSSSNTGPPPWSVSVSATPGPGYGGQLDEARDRIRAARKAGIISKHEARQLRREADVIERHAELYGRDGLSDAERTELETRALYLGDAAGHHPATGVGGGD